MPLVALVHVRSPKAQPVLHGMLRNWFLVKDCQSEQSAHRLSLQPACSRLLCRFVCGPPSFLGRLLSFAALIIQSLFKAGTISSETPTDGI